MLRADFEISRLLPTVCTIQTDASGRAIGAVLSQVGGDDEEHPVAYYSRKLLPREEKYSTVEKECLAIILHGYRVYLLGRPFVIQTDHRSLEWLDRLKENNGRLTRWSLALQPYQYSVQYRTGQKNENADALSRYFVDATSEWKECQGSQPVLKVRSATIERSTVTCQQGCIQKVELKCCNMNLRLKLVICVCIYKHARMLEI